MVTLIIAASLMLIVSDWEQRAGSRAGQHKYPLIAIMQISSTPLLDAHVAGVLDRLKDQGMVAPDRSNLRFYNAQADFATASTIASEIVSSPADIVITASTPALQIFSKANATAKKHHVFGAVTDPYGAGVGITGKKPDQHLPYMAGIGTFQPVKRAFSILREMNPAIKRAGVVRNAGEQCSEACMVEARAICGELDIELLDAVAGNTSEVSEAARSLIAKGVEAIWIGGDTIATASSRLIIRLAKDAGIPVFTNDPSDADAGALFGIGANYFTVGQYTADVAVSILKGKSPADFAIENVIPEQLKINREVMASFEGKYSLTPEIQQLLDKPGITPKKILKPEPGKNYNVSILYFAPAPVFEFAISGFRKKMKSLGFIEGKNLILSIEHANTDMAMLNQMVTSAAAKKPDLIVPLSTPALVSVMHHAKESRIVFGVVSAPLEAGVGDSLERHLPNVTGVHYATPVPEVFDWSAKLLPNAKRIGVLYNPSEVNSVQQLKDLRKIAAAHSVTVEAVTITSTSEVAENIHAVLAGNVDHFFVPGDNTAGNGLPSILKACANKNIPVIVNDCSLMGSGGIISGSPGPYSHGEEVAELSARVLLGESPADIPIARPGLNELSIDPAAMKKYGIAPPRELLVRADRFYNVAELRGRPARLAMINLVDNSSMDEAMKGVETGLEDSGLRKDTDYVLKKYSAQGEVGQLPQIIDAALMEKPDAIVTLTTPALIAAAKKVKEVPVIFTVASDPFKAGVFTEGHRPENFCGVHDDPPVSELLGMAKKHDPELSAVGIVYDASQINSMISVEKLRIAGQQQNIRILEATASTVPDLDMATSSLVQRGAKALVISADNLANTGFPVIHKVARGVDIPVYVDNLALVEQGATGGVGDDYRSWGRQSGILAAKVLAGASPVILPINPTKDKRRIEPVTADSRQVEHAPWKLRMVLYSETRFAEDCHDGLMDGIKKAGLVEGKDYELKVYNAQGDMSTLSSIMTTIKADRPDLLMVISTPTLQAALRQAGNDTRIVFTGVGDGVQAGAGKSETDHLPNVTGITTSSSFDGMAQIISETLPGVKAVGTLFTPAEINSEIYKNLFMKALEKKGIRLEAVPVASSADVAQAADELCRKDIQAVAQIVDNLTRPGFGLVSGKAAVKNMPVYVFDSAQMKEGGAVCLARDYYDAGLETAQKVLRILDGEKPENIPFNNTESEKLILNYELAKKYGLTLSGSLTARAKPFTIK